MDDAELKEELQHQRELIKGYRKRQRVLERQASIFGLHVPPHIPIEINELSEVIRACEDKIAELNGEDDDADEYDDMTHLRHRRRFSADDIYPPVIQSERTNFDTYLPNWTMLLGVVAFTLGFILLYVYKKVSTGATINNFVILGILIKPTANTIMILGGLFLTLGLICLIRTLIYISSD